MSLSLIPCSRRLGYFVSKFTMLGSVVFMITTSDARSGLTLEQCSVISDGVNKSLPTKIEQGVVAHSTRCEALNGSPTLIYLMKVPSAKIDLQALRQHSINYWCDDPKQKRNLRVMGVSYRYLHSSTGNHIGTNAISIDDCPRSYRR